MFNADNKTKIVDNFNLLNYKELIENNPCHIATVNSNKEPNLSVASDIKILDKNIILISNNEMINTPDNIVSNENIVHYALGLKPWQDDKVFLASHFWDYAKDSLFYDDIVAIRDNFDTISRLKKERAGIDIQIQALEYADSPNTFKKKLS